MLAWNFFLSHFKIVELRYSYSGDTVFLQNETSKCKLLHLSINSLVSSLTAMCLDFLTILKKFFSETFCFKFWWRESIRFSHCVPLEKKDSPKPREKSPRSYNYHSSWIIFHHFYSLCHHGLFFSIWSASEAFPGHRGGKQKKTKKAGLEKSQRHTYICFFFLPFL